MLARKTLETAASELVFAISLLTRRLRSELASDELSWTQLAVMARLDREGPATTADLARAEGIKPQSMGATLAALEEQAIVDRRPHPTDGRQVNIALTTKGAALRKQRGLAKQTWLAERITKLDSSERATLFAATDLIKHLAEL